MASPYSHADPAVERDRFEAVCRVAARMMAAGEIVFSPIAHTHPIAMAGTLPRDWEFWKRQDTALLVPARKLVVVKMDGLEKSTGVEQEKQIATRLGIPIEYVDAEG
ncbi:MAG: DUF1937 family protein [bacterium]|nr:DUF1937 family protein [bacterium]